MCGIAAIIDYAKIEPKLEDIKSMTDLMVHRGPDGEGHFIKGGVAMGHRRLAIIDTDSRSNQPMHRSDLHLVYNGMVYNYIEIKAELSELGITFNTTSDTEVILAAYEQWGISAFEKFNGMWAIILFDEKKNKIICSRDRFGIKPLYYTQIGNKIYFASEIKAFGGITDWQPKINHTRLMEYLAHNMTDHTDETMFQGVYQITKSCHGIIDLQSNKMTIDKYYDITKGKSNDGKDFMRLFYDAIKIRTRTDVPLATTLSGGVDSSSIVSVMADKMKYKPNTYTLAYPEHSLDESKYALKVNKKYSIPSHLITTTEEYLKNHLEDLIYQQDEPFTGATVMAQSHIYENINLGGYKVTIGGQGGDEILCGYDKFSLGYLKEKIKSKPIEALTELYHIQKKKSIKFKDGLQKLITYNRSIENEKNNWYPLTADQEKTKYKRIDENSVFNMSYNLLFGIGISALLRYEDRNSMAYSVESRLPFLDYTLVEYCLHMKSSLKIHKGITKKILRNEMFDIVPNEILERTDKMGFVTPQNEWMNSNKKYYLDLAHDAITKMPFIDKAEVEKMIQRDNSFLWRIINTGLWISKFNIAV